MNELIAYVVPCIVIIVWVVWRFISIIIPYWLEQLIQYIWLAINAILLLFTHGYWNMICLIIMIGTILFSLGLNTETGVYITGRGFRESALERLDERRFHLKSIDDIRMDINIVAITIQIILILVYVMS
jgi:hypothetical protein